MDAHGHEAAIRLIRIVALHGPVRRPALECWDIGAPEDFDQRLAVAWLLARGFIAERDGRVDLPRLIGKPRPVLAAAQVDAIESAVRVALLALGLAKKPGNLWEMLAEAARGIAAARRADAEKGER